MENNFNSDYDIRLATLEAMGGDMTKKYDSTYSIDLEILRLMQEGGGVGGGISDVDALPDASENKNKFVRLSSDENVYVSELKSKTTLTTDRLPDEQQIDKAYIIATNYSAPNNIWYYKGLFTIIYADNTQEYFYGWYNPNIAGDGFWGFIFTKYDAVNIEKTNHFAFQTAEEYSQYMSVDWNTNTLTYTTDEVEPEGDIDDSPNILWDTNWGNYYMPIPATYNAPESAQIGNAYIYDNGTLYTIYTGDEITLVLSDGSHTVYKWTDKDERFMYFTDKKASEIYCYNNTEDDLVFYNFDFLYIDDLSEYIVSGNTYTNLNVSYNDLKTSLAVEEYQYLYIPQLNAPDSEQVGQATINDDWNSLTFTYNDNWTIKVTSDGTSSGTFIEERVFYGWVSNEPQGDIAFDLILTVLSPNNIYTSDYIGGSNISSFYGDVDENNKIIYTSETISEILSSYFNPEAEHINNADIVKYQRTEVTEEWDWQPLTDNATNDDIDLMFAAPESPVVKRVLMKDSEDYGYSINEGWINFNDETMSYDGGTYYKWLKYSESSGEAVEDNNYYILTDTLNPTLPFDVNSNECVYCFEKEIEGVTYRIESNETYSKIALIHEDGSITYEE